MHRVGAADGSPEGALRALDVAVLVYLVIAKTTASRGDNGEGNSKRKKRSKVLVEREERQTKKEVSTNNA